MTLSFIWPVQFRLIMSEHVLLLIADMFVYISCGQLFPLQDVDTIYLTQDTRELNLQDFSHLENR